MAHVYIHVPFCTRRCSYCDFAIAVRKRVPAQEYITAVSAELALRADETRSGDAGGTIYFGGGTPSRLPPVALTVLLDAVARRFCSTPSLDAVEASLEVNPEDVTPAAAESWRRAGFNRISLGAQSFDDRVLRWMHRSHDAARIAEAMRAVRAAGFANVSLDLIFALPAELARDWDRDLDRAVELAPEHLSLYGLTVEPRTPLARWVSRGAVLPGDDARYADEYLRAHERLGAAGYRFYEVSNAARGDLRSRHNSAYWSGRPYLGLGPAAHSFDGHTRRWNLPAWEAYRRAVLAGRSPIEAEEALTPEQRDLERVYLSLRTSEGLSLTAPNTVLDRPLPSSTVLVSKGWALRTDDHLVLTAEGWLRLDAIVAALTGHRAVA